MKLLTQVIRHIWLPDSNEREADGDAFDSIPASSLNRGEGNWSSGGGFLKRHWRHPAEGFLQEAQHTAGTDGAKRVLSKRIDSD